MAERKKLSKEQIDEILDIFRKTLENRLEEKGYGTFSSKHEIAGVVDEEWLEMHEALRKNDANNFHDELLDIAVGCVFGAACVRNNTTDW